MELGEGDRPQEPRVKIVCFENLNYARKKTPPQSYEIGGRRFVGSENIYDAPTLPVIYSVSDCSGETADFVGTGGFRSSITVT